jgi:hypothetical protein
MMRFSPLDEGFDCAKRSRSNHEKNGMQDKKVKASHQLVKV